PPCSFLQGEASSLNYAKPGANGFEALTKFRVSAAEETAAINALPKVHVSLGGMTTRMLPRVPWVWTRTTARFDVSNGKLSWFVRASAFPTNTIYVDGAQINEIPQGDPSVLLGPRVRTADKPRQTAAEEEAQRETPISVQDETVRPGGFANGE